MRESSDFALLRKAGSSKAGKCLVMSAMRVDGLSFFQFGLITGRKIGNAVERNLVRRRLREIIRLHQPRLQPGWKWVVIARWRAPKVDYPSLERDWLRLAAQLGVLSPSPPS